jgi:hypothetical protein
MKKILATFTFTLLLTLNLAVLNVNAQGDQAAELSQCIEACMDGDSDRELPCTSSCQDRLNRTEYLPPLVKPSLLPGPKFSNNEQRTGDEVTGFVTERLLPQIATRLITIVAISSMLGIVYAGILFFSAMGDPEKANKGKDAAIYSVIGLVIALLSFTIVQIISSLPLNTI